MIYKTVFLLFYVFCVCVSDEGDACFKDGVPGTCINIRNCKSAIEDLKNRKNPQICSFIGSDPVVCCVGAAPAPPPTTSTSTTTTTTKAPVATTTKKPTQQPAVAPTADDDDDEYVNNDGSPTGCEPIDPKLTSKKIGQKAFDMCVEYQQKLIYPCKRGVALIGDFSRSFLCHHNADELIIGGEPAAENEFPHMVLLGFGPDIASVEWQCGGSLISDQWVLTAGHCTLRRRDDPVTFALMGALRRSDPLSPDKLRKVAQYLSSPDYNPPNRYNDIALVKLDKPVTLSQFLVPACVHIGDAAAEERALATGWGLTEYRGAVADQLQKVILNKFTLAECSAKFPKQRLMKQGFDNATQVCYGDKDKSKDTCQGDSGGPIQIKSKRLHCMYVVTGVTSFGKRCGNIGDPGIYTRVSNYLDWIEKTVWP